MKHQQIRERDREWIDKLEEIGVDAAARYPGPIAVARCKRLSPKKIRRLVAELAASFKKNKLIDTKHWGSAERVVRDTVAAWFEKEAVH